MSFTPAHDAVEPFPISVPDADLADLRNRLAATRWPDRDSVPRNIHGVFIAGHVRKWNGTVLDVDVPALRQDVRASRDRIFTAVHPR